jgi:hypothetical protein
MINSLLLAVIAVPSGVSVCIERVKRLMSLKLCSHVPLSQPHRVAMVLGISILRATILAAIEATSEEVIASLRKSASTYRPGSDNYSNLDEILKPTESISPNSVSSYHFQKPHHFALGYDHMSCFEIIFLIQLFHE